MVWVRLGSLAPETQAEAAADNNPVPLTCRHLVEPVPAEEITKLVVEALVVDKVVDVALVVVELLIVRFVIVLVELLKITLLAKYDGPVALKMRLPSAELIPESFIYIEPVPARMVPFTHKFEAKVEVAFVPVPLTSRNPAMVVVPVPAIAKFPPFEIVKYVEVAESASLDVPILKMPSMADKSQCLAFVGASESVRDKYGVDEATESDQFGVVVPMPTFLFELTIRPFPATVRSEEKRLVELAVVAKLVVEVALVVVLLSPVKLARVEEALETKPLLKYQERFVVSVVLAV